MQRSIESLPEENITKLESTIDYVYKDKCNVMLALTHSSYANENKALKLNSNERLEFLGDAILNIAISEYIYKNYENLPEGEMTKMRASIVCEASLMRCSNAINLGKYLFLGKGEEVTGGRSRTSILSDAFEALIGSIYLDSGFENARLFIYASMREIIGGTANGDTFIDYKTQLQEKAQKISDQKIIYDILEEKGPDHNKFFVAQVSLGERVMGTGEGKSKKEAEQKAAAVALSKIEEH
jgi:ribonuclease-3